MPLTPSRGDIWVKFAAAALTATGGQVITAAKIADIMYAEFQDRWEEYNDGHGPVWDQKKKRIRESNGDTHS